MAISSKYIYLTNVIRTALETLITGDDSDLIVATGNKYANARDRKKIGFGLGDKYPKQSFTTAFRNHINEQDTEQGFIIILHEELSKSTDAMDDIEDRLGHWFVLLDNLLLTLGKGQTFTETKDGVDLNTIRIINTTTENALHFGVEQGESKNPELGIIYNCKFYYDQINH